MRILVTTLLIEIFWRVKITMNQKIPKKSSFTHISKFVAGALTLIPGNTYTHVFRTLFDFCNF